MNNNFKRAIWIKVVLVYLISGAYVFGQHVQISRAEELSLSVDPPLIHMTRNVSDEVSAKVVVKNSGASTLDLKVLLRPFRALSEDGSIEIIPENQVPIPYKNLFSDIKIIDSGLEVRELKLAPEQAKNLEIKISSDFISEPGDYYFTIIFLGESESTPPDTSTRDEESAQEEIVSGHSVIEAGIGVNVILGANTEFVPQAEIAEFSAPRTVESGPVAFNVRIKNNGARVIRPKGVILIRNMFGQTVGRVDLDQVNVLAGGIRILPGADFTGRIGKNSDKPEGINEAAIWPEGFLLGLYSADLSLALSDEGPVLNKTIYFVGLPVITAIIFLLFIGFVIFIIFRVNHYLRRQK